MTTQEDIDEDSPGQCSRQSYIISDKDKLAINNVCIVSLYIYTCIWNLYIKADTAPHTERMTERSGDAVRSK